MEHRELDQVLEKIAARIKEYRLNKNYKQEYLAAKLGCSQNSYSKMENRRTELSVRNLYQIAHILGTTVPDILAGL